MFGKTKKSDAQKALEERGLDIYKRDETIVYKDDYLALVQVGLHSETLNERYKPHIVACSDLIKEGYTLVIWSGLIVFTKTT